MEVEGTERGAEPLHCIFRVDKASALSTKIDFDEIKFYAPPIGDGSFGTVYRGVWRSLDVAIKVYGYFSYQL